MFKNTLIKKVMYLSITTFSVFITLTQCAKNFTGESFAPSTAQATISTITANGGGSLYCSISGGCPLRVTGSDFYDGARIYIDNTGDGITVHPNGRWIYMGLTGQKRVAAYNLDQSTGVLTGIGTPLLNNSTTGYTDNGGSGANVSPDGLYFYGTAFSTVATDPKKIIIYAIDQTTGDLALSSEADTGGGPNDIRVDTNGLFAYTCNSKDTPSISSYRRTLATGALTALSPRDLSIPAANYGPGIMVIQK